MGLAKDRDALRALDSPTITVAEIVAIIADSTYDADVRTVAVRHSACTFSGLRDVLETSSDRVLNRFAMDSADPDILQHLVCVADG